MIFVDTGGWFAYGVRRDTDHARTRSWFRSNTEPLVTSDFVFDGLMTLLRSRGRNDLALSLGARLLDGTLARMYYLTPDDIRETWETFRRYDDKAWSFTDCSSKVVMEQSASPAPSRSTSTSASLGM